MFGGTGQADGGCPRAGPHDEGAGGHAILVSGGFTRFAEPVAAEIGFDRAIANYLEIAHGKLTGTVRKPIVGSDTKEKTLLAALDELGIGAAESMAVGDGANDLAMIRRAGLGVAYRAKPIVAVRRRRGSTMAT